MSYLPITVQPGFSRQNTEYQAGKPQPRWWDGNLVRWYGRRLGPIGGWRTRSSNQVTGKARAMLPWRTSSAQRWIGIGTHTGLFVQSSAGTVYDITPVGFVAGNADESASVGFGGGVFGGGTFGTPRRDTGSFVSALTWDLDTWGELLVGCAFSDGNIYEWDLVNTDKATQVTNSPIDCLGCVVTEQGHLMAIGADGDPRKIKWSGQYDRNDWTPSATNQAGDIGLSTVGTIVRAVKLGPLVLVLTDLDAHIGRYVGLPNVWAFERVGYGCGVISKGSVATIGQQAFWWSRSGFWVYDGGTRTIECDVYDHLTSSLNNAQKSKITSYHNAEFGEVWWHYPSTASVENDDYVYFDYRRNHWAFGQMARTCGAEISVFKYLLAIDPDGYCYEHEISTAWGGAVPWAETGPFEMGNGDRVMRCDEIVADEATNGQVTVGFRTRPYPNAAETVVADTTVNSEGRGFVRFTAREVRVRFTSTGNDNWRVGDFRLNVNAGGRR